MSTNLFYELVSTLIVCIIPLSCCAVALWVVFCAWKHDKNIDDVYHDDYLTSQIKTMHNAACFLFTFNSILLVITLCLIIIGFGFFQNETIYIVLKNLSLTMMLLPLFSNQFFMYFIAHKTKSFIPKEKPKYALRTTKF